MSQHFSRILVPAASTVELETDGAGGVRLRVLVGDQVYTETRVGGAPASMSGAEPGLAAPASARLGGAPPPAPVPRSGL